MTMTKGNDVGAIADALNLAVGATTPVYVKAADKWHILKKIKDEYDQHGGYDD